MGNFKRTIGLLAVSASSVAMADAPGWTISESSGRVFVGSAGISRAATRGAALSAGDIVSTAANSRAVLVRGGEYLVLAPNSNIQIAKPATAGGITAIIENFGNVIYTIRQKMTPHFGVQTPYLAAVVKGTTFSVTVTEKGASVQVIEGRVEVSTRDGGASYMVLPGDIGSVSANAPLSLAVQGRETRTIESPNKGAVSGGAAPDPVDAQPAPASDAKPTLDGTITADVSEGPVSLAAMSNGMVQGDSSLTAVVAAVRTAAAEPGRATPIANPPLVRPVEPEPVRSPPILPVEVDTKPTPTPTPIPIPTPPSPPPVPLPPVQADVPPSPAPIELPTVPPETFPADIPPAPLPPVDVSVDAAPPSPPLPLPVETQVPGPPPKVPVQIPLPQPKPEPILLPPEPAPGPIVPEQTTNSPVGNGIGNNGPKVIAPIVDPIILTVPIGT